MIANSIQQLVPGHRVEDPAPGPRRSTVPRTTPVEHLLVLGTVAILPLENHLPRIAGLPIVWSLFALLGLYILFFRMAILQRVAGHPVLLAGYLLIGAGFLAESMHENPNHGHAIRIGQMFMGAMFIATLCRDRQGLRMGLYGIFLSGLGLSFLLWFTSYSALNAAEATGYHEASTVRGEVFANFGIGGNLNQFAFLASEGAVVALALALLTRDLVLRWVFVGMTLVGLVGAFLPLSRSGILIAVVSSGVVLATYYRNQLRGLGLIAVLLFGLVVLVPDVVWERFTLRSQASSSGRLDARSRVYTAALESLPQSFVVGVGAGNFWSGWGKENGFAYGATGTLGAHNCYFQVTIYWGIAGLIALLLVIWQAFRCVPAHARMEFESLSLVGIAVASLIFSMFMHNIYVKEFSVMLGMLVGASLFIWPSKRLNRPDPNR